MCMLLLVGLPITAVKLMH